MTKPLRISATLALLVSGGDGLVSLRRSRCTIGSLARSSRRLSSGSNAAPILGPTANEVELKSYVAELKAIDAALEPERRDFEDRAAWDAQARAYDPPVAEAEAGSGSSSVPFWALAPGWEELGGNFILRPPPGTPARAVLHFLGGAFVGAAPHVTYRYLLQRLAAGGFVVVTTPYHLSFDYLAACDAVLEHFEKAAVPLAREYGALPVVGVGHSCGALLHVLITSLFPDTPRAANALISFNNKDITEAIPAFDDVVLPLAAAAMAESPDAVAARAAILAGRDLLAATLEDAARALLAKAGGDAGAGDGDAAAAAASTAVNVDALGALGDVSVLAAGVAKDAAVLGGELLLGDPSLAARRLEDLRATLGVLDQIPPLFEALAAGTKQFTPTPHDCRASCRRMYRARRTLLVKFANDPIDESDELAGLINESKEVMRLKRPMVKFDIKLETIAGDHITPLTQDVFVPLQPLDALDVAGLKPQARDAFLQTVDGTAQVLLDWLAEVTEVTGSPEAAVAAPAP